MNFFGRISSQALVLVLLFAFSACSYKAPPKETPAPTNSGKRIPKTFFADFDSKGNVTRYKTFACGWSPEKVAGRWGTEIFAYYNHADHCNMIFVPTETALIGKLVNPSYPDDIERWSNVISIPITKHYNYEPELDKYQRKTHREIENSTRDHWSARPYIELDLKGLQIQEWSYAIYWDNPQVDNIVDEEWDFGREFFAFTAEVHSSLFLSRIQGKVRFNFLRFETDPSFKETPYSEENARHVNVLHVLGETVNGKRQVLKAGRWDTRVKHTIYLNNFPEDVVPIANDVIELWNDAFQEIGHGRPFRTEVRNAKYAFDLRYPGITWVDDKYLSLNAPLGVGMVTSDVKNGKVLWGGVTIWGGMLEKIINSYSPALHAAAMVQPTLTRFSDPTIQFALLERENPLTSLAASKPAYPTELRDVRSAAEVRAILRQSILTQKQAPLVLNSLLSGSAKLSATERDAIIRGVIENPAFTPRNSSGAADPLAREKEEFARAARAQLGRLSPLLNPDTPGAFDRFAEDFVRTQHRIAQAAANRGSTRDFLNADFIQGLIAQPTLTQSMKSFPTFNARDLKGLVEQGNRLSAANLRKLLEENIALGAQATAFDADRRISDVAYQWNAAIARTGTNKTLALRAFIKDLLLHEVGHMFGLGHNFKENILPKRGSVPDKYLDGPNGLVARAKDQHKNYSTVMGYKNGTTDVITKYDELAPGPNDLLVLRYLYNQEYPVFPKEADAGDDYKFVKLDMSGKIVDETRFDGRAYRVAYFPSCNDLDASLGSDPYCNRWDRGSSATELVDNYFQDYRGTLSSQLYAFANNVQGGSYWMKEYYLWMHSFNVFQRTRLFYDYMRQKYETELASLLAVGGEARAQNLLEFSQACRSGDPARFHNKMLADFFSRPEHAEIKDLCVAVGNMFEELQTVLQLPGPDSTKIDYFDAYAPSSIFGGDARPIYDRYLGTWKEIARTPLKFSALLAMTSAQPFVNFNGWLLPIFRYSRFDSSYLLNTFYPKEFAKSLAATVDHNLTFANTSLETRTKIGKPVLALGYFLTNNFLSNDPLSIDQSYIKNIREQTLFSYKVVAVEVERKQENGEEIARKFSGTIHQLYGRGPEPVPQIFMYTNDRVITPPPNRSLLYPVSSIRWYSASGGYYFAIKMDYPEDFYDRLKSHSVRQTLESMYYQTINACLEGKQRNGLRYFFNDNVSNFPGFIFPAGIYQSTPDRNKFYQSLEAQFERYYANVGNMFAVRPDPKDCEEALRGQGLLVLAASAINGYYLFDLYDYIEKGED